MKRKNASLQRIEPFFEKIGELTKVQRILICAAVAVVLIGVFGYFLYLPKFNRISDLRGDIGKAEEKLTRTKRQAQAYDAFKKQYEEAKARFELVARALPEKEEIPSLLTAISQAGKAAGLKFLLFQPQDEIVKDFYAEIHVKMELAGTYHDLGVFYDKLARLSRIVNVSDFSISKTADNADNPGSALQISCTAVTYKFIEQAAAAENKSKKKR